MNCRLKNIFKLNRTGFAITCLSILLFIQSSQGFAASPVSTAVIGFVNMGKDGDDINVLLTRSFISFFSKMPGAKIVPYAASFPLAEDKGFFKKKNLDTDLAILIGQSLSARQVLTGTYKLLDGKTIEMDLIALDTASGETLFKRHYEGKAAASLLDTIDTVRKNAAGLLAGRDVATANLNIRVMNTAEAYDVLIGGNVDGTANPGYQKSFPVGAAFDLSLRRRDNSLEVFRTNISLNTAKDINITYRPSAPIFIQSAFYPMDIWQNGFKVGKVNSRESYTAFGLSIDTTYRIYLQNKEYRSVLREVKLTEGRPSAITFASNEFFPRVHYAALAPPLDLLLPGLVQLQARDYSSALLFGGLWVADVTGFILCLQGYLVSDHIVNTDPRSEYVEFIKPYRTFYGVGSIITGVGWLGIALGAYFHAEGMKQMEDLDRQYSIYLSPSEEGGLTLCFSAKFN